MNRVLKAGGVWLAIAALVWLTSIWRWQSVGRDVSPAEIVGQLVLLPVLLALALLGAVWGVGWLRTLADRPLALPSASAKPSAAHTDGAAPEDEAHATQRSVKAWVLASAVHLPAGDEPLAAWQCMTSRAHRPGLDAALHDVDGMPVMAARVADLSVEASVEELSPHLVEGEPVAACVARAWALMQAPLQQLLETLAELPAADAMTADQPGMFTAEHGATDPGVPMKAHLSGVARPVPAAVAQARSAMAPQLTIRVLMPAGWAVSQRDALVAAMRSRCGTLLDWVARLEARGIHWHTDPVSQPEAWWAEFDQTLQQWARDPRPQLMLLLAADSSLDQDCVDRMQTRGELFTAAHQIGRMPGEGAVGMLLSNGRGPWHEGHADRSDLPLVLWRPACVRRERSADAVGRVGTEALRAALQAALQQASAAGDPDPAHLLVAADADHRASRAAELFEALQEAVPGLDPMVSVVRIGEACGDLGLVGALAPLALASAALQAREAEATHALAVHLQSPHERIVLALAAVPPSGPPAHSATSS